MSLSFAFGTVLIFAFIYWQSAVWETQRVDQFLLHESLAIQREPPGVVTGDVATRFAPDMHRQSFAAIFSGARRTLSGDLVYYPAGLAADGLVHHVTAIRRGPRGDLAEQVRAIAADLPDGRIVVVGRTEQDLATLRLVVLRSLELGLLPGLALALGVGVFASRRTLNRVRRVNRSITRIMAGNLRERLESGGSADALDQLALSVNLMLDQIERLVDEVRGVGDDIAHDLRTPLARMRARLERAQAGALPQADMHRIAGEVIADLDQALVTITALLRIGQIEAGARRAGFGIVDLDALALEAADFYRPLAENRGITLTAAEAGPPATPAGARQAALVLGDRDLLFEVAANLLDNALKFTGDGGRVCIDTEVQEDRFALVVTDNGCGIPEAEREAALRRFYRGDRSRHVAGHGLGLSLVAAIARLHGFSLELGDVQPGLRVALMGQTAQQPHEREAGPI